MNRLGFIVLSILSQNGATNKLSSMSVQEISDTEEFGYKPNTIFKKIKEFPSGVRDEERVRPAFLQAAADISGVFEFLDFFEDCVRLITEFFRVGNLLNRHRR